MIIKKDMSTTRPEFFRSLAVALNGFDHKIDGNHIIVGNDDKRIDLNLSPLPPRILSISWHMERWLLTMQFTGYKETERNDFLVVFDRAFQRGGG